MGILLTDEEMFYIGMDITKGGGDYADILEVIRAGAKAQLKKVVEWGDKPCPCQMVPEFTNRIQRECYDCWQALLKEIE